MAGDMVSLLRSCNSSVDPNLISLVPDGVGELKPKLSKQNV